MIFRANSHRVYEKLFRIYPNAIWYQIKNIERDTGKGYLFIPDQEKEIIEQVLKIKGITKARSQNLEDYRTYWLSAYKP